VTRRVGALVALILVGRLPPPAPPPAIDFVPPLTPDQQKTSPQFFEILNFTLRFARRRPPICGPSSLLSASGRRVILMPTN
jgi:hypothetical protein